MTQAFAPPLLAVPGFDHVDTWIFDLDNTLYPSRRPALAAGGRADHAVPGRVVGLDGMSARALQKYYYTRYGTTLKGLMDEHAISSRGLPRLRARHRPLAARSRSRRSAGPSRRCPGRKLILTNGSRQHAENVAGKLGIREHFEEIFDIVAADFVPKPEARDLRALPRRARRRSVAGGDVRGPRQEPRRAARAGHADGPRAARRRRTRSAKRTSRRPSRRPISTIPRPT